MSLKDELKSEVTKIFKGTWEETTGRVVPVPSDVGLGNQATLLEQAVVLYADLDGSTNMVDRKKWQFSAEIYKTFLHCAAKIVRGESGDITAYDGDRIMAVFIGDGKYDRAARTALKLKWAVRNIVQPAMKEIYDTDFIIAHTVGIDVSDLRAVRTGVRGDNDLVWVGRAANYAAKLTTLSSDYQTRITKSVYDKLSSSVKNSTDGKPMWEEKTWTAMNNMLIYRSAWGWVLN
jgi:class 3 adenylate cyclase